MLSKYEILKIRKRLKKCERRILAGKDVLLETSKAIYLTKLLLDN